MTELTSEQNSILEKVQKLLRLANRNANEAEAASATAKAQQLLTAYNLDLAMIGEVSAGDAKRETTKLKGGAYLYQRWLWNNVAELNFCYYWTDRKWTHYKVRGKMFDGTPTFRDWPRFQWHHFIVGRVVNVVATKVMAEYLDLAVERLLRDRLRNKATGEVPNTELFSKWSVSYRTGAMNRIVEKIQERRDELKAEEHRKATERARSGVSVSNALTISTYASAEEDANMDHIYGEGWSARQASLRAERAAARREADEAYTRWAAENPEEARQEEAKERASREKKASRRRVSTKRSPDKLDSGAYYAGYDAAEAISIEAQVEGTAQKMIGSHG